MITVTINELLNSTSFFKKLGKCSLQAKTAFKIAKIMKIIDEEIEIFDSTKIRVLKKYADLDENGELILNNNGEATISKEKQKEYKKEMIELLDSTINLQVDRINLNDLENTDFSPNELINVEKFIEE